MYFLRYQMQFQQVRICIFYSYIFAVCLLRDCLMHDLQKSVRTVKLATASYCRVLRFAVMQYTLETFTENRSTSWDQEPYKG